MYKIFTILFSIVSISAYSQNDSLDLEKCRNLSLERYPLTNDTENNIETNRLKIQNIKTIYYPRLNLTGQYIHYSDVPHVTIDNPLFSIPTVSKDQYKIMLEANQVIYDGGLTNRLKALENVNLMAENQDIQVKLYALNKQVNEVYFLILLFQEQQELLKLAHNNLNEQLKVVASGVRNGVLLPGDADVVKAEILKIDQRMLELRTGKVSGMEILSELMDSSLNKESNLVVPEYQYQLPDSTLNRPEYILMDLQSEKLEKLNKLNSAYRFPYIGLFGQFGYGYPGANMLEDKANIIYTYGIKLSWNIWDWGKTKRDKQINRVIQNKIVTQHEVFDKNLRIAITKEINNIKKLDETVKSDQEIIKLRERISSAKASQLKNGVITSSQYILELNAETQAKISKQLHEIQRLQTIVNLYTLTGDINK